MSLFIAECIGVASYLEMFIPFFFNQRIVLNCNCVPHVVFLKKCFLPICFNMTPPYPGMTLILSWLVFIAFLCKKRGLKCLLRIRGGEHGISGIIIIHTVINSQDQWAESNAFMAVMIIKYGENNFAKMFVTSSRHLCL